MTMVPDASDPAGAAVIGERLGRTFFARDPAVVAADLVGRVLVVPGDPEPIVLRLTETEAYHGQSDPASHAYRGPTPRTAVMFGAPGLLYVYFVYGVHWCANIVTGTEGEAAAVLLRAAAVAGGVERVRRRRRSPAGRIPSDRDLARGPARLAAAIGLGGADSGADLLGAAAPFTVHRGDGRRPRLGTGPRVGISAAVDVPWRFFDADAAEVSDYRAGGRRRTARGRAGRAPQIG